jgi:chaperonin cofactor prefoldin
MLLLSTQYFPPNSADQVRTLVEKDIEKVKDEEKAAHKERDDTEKRLKKLKTSLYSKFGNSINLEE